jgi:aryl-alcohol dehydrogenase-like predicted oxidoreductase
MGRREFIAAVAGLVAGAAGASASRAEGPPVRATELPTRRLGRTDLHVPILGPGGYHIGRAGSEQAARAVVEAAFEEGLRFFDTAESYQRGTAERWLGAALEGVRGDVLLMTKTFNLETRSAESARRHLEGSLSRLRTDYLDLWQLHSVRTVEDVDRAFRPGGAMEYILEAREQGLVRFVGVTGHAMPEANRRAVAYWDRGLRFDTMQLPLNPIDYHRRSFQREVLPGLVERDIGVIAMKTSAQGALLGPDLCTVEECLRYVWSLPVGVAVVGMERPELVQANARLARAFTPMSPTEAEALRTRIAPQARLGLERYKA